MLPSEAAVKQSAGPSPRAGALNLAHCLTLAVLFASGAVARFLFLARKPFWFDECFSVAAARLDWPNFVHLLWWREANMSLYYVLLRGWLHFGYSEFFIRSLSVIAAVATLPAIYWLASLLFDRRVGVIAVALLSFNAYHVRYAQEARSYAWLVLLATLSSGFFVAGLQSPSRRNRLGYVLTSIFAVYAHFYALLLIVAQGLAVRLLDGGGEAKRSQAAAQVRRTWIWIGVCVLPLLIFVGKTGAGPIRWIQRPGPRDLLDYFEYMAGNYGWGLLLPFVVACSVAVIPVKQSLFRRTSNWETWRVQFLLIWLLFPVALTVLLSLARPVFLARYLIFCLPALVILAAAGLARLAGWRVAAALAALLVLSLQGTLSYYDHDFDLERDGSGAASNYVLDHAEPGDAVIFHIASTRAAYEFYRSLRTGGAADSRLGAEIIYPRNADRLDYRDFTGKPTDEFLRATSIRYKRVWVVLMNNRTSSGPDASTVGLTQILGESFPGRQQWQFPRAEVRLYSRE